MVTVSVRIRKDLHKRLKEYAKENKETMSEVVEKALRAYMAEY